MLLSFYASGLISPRYVGYETLVLQVCVSGGHMFLPLLDLNSPVWEESRCLQCSLFGKFDAVDNYQAFGTSRIRTLHAAKQRDKDGGLARAGGERDTNPRGTGGNRI